jgi:hypothetical protein
VQAARLACRKLIGEIVSIIQRQIGKLFLRAAELLKKVGARRLQGVAARAHRIGQRQSFHGLMRKVEHIDVRSPVDGAHFYPGRAPDGTRMGELAARNTDGVSSVTVEKTPGGRYFNEMELYEPGSPVSTAQADKVWDRISAQYAEQARGKVTVWAHDPSPSSTWARIERPILEKKSDVEIVIADSFD